MYKCGDHCDTLARRHPVSKWCQQKATETQRKTKNKTDSLQSLDPSLPETNIHSQYYEDQDISFFHLRGISWLLLLLATKGILTIPDKRRSSQSRTKTSTECFLTYVLGTGVANILHTRTQSSGSSKGLPSFMMSLATQHCLTLEAAEVFHVLKCRPSTSVHSSAKMICRWRGQKISG